MPGAGLSGLSRSMPDETCLLAPHRSALRLPEPGIMKNPPRADFPEALEVLFQGVGCGRGQTLLYQSEMLLAVNASWGKRTEAAYMDI